MAEASPTTKIERPQYLHVPTPERNGDTVFDGKAPATETASPRPAAGIRAIEAVPTKDRSEAIIEAATILQKLAQAQIDWHENRARRLREVCAAFGAMAGVRHSAAGESPLNSEVAFRTLVDLLRTIKPEGDQE